MWAFTSVAQTLERARRFEISREHSALCCKKREGKRLILNLGERLVSKYVARPSLCTSPTYLLTQGGRSVFKAALQDPRWTPISRNPMGLDPISPGVKNASYIGLLEIKELWSPVLHESKSSGLSNSPGFNLPTNMKIDFSKRTGLLIIDREINQKRAGLFWSQHGRCSGEPAPSCRYYSPQA